MSTNTANTSCDTTYGRYRKRGRITSHVKGVYSPWIMISSVPRPSTQNPQKTSACIMPPTGSRKIFVCANPISRKFFVRCSG